MPYCCPVVHLVALKTSNADRVKRALLIYRIEINMAYPELFVAYPDYFNYTLRMKKQLLIIANTPSVNTQKIVDHVIKGASISGPDNVNVRYTSPLDTSADDVLASDAIILGTTENFAYMSGALKDFFDRCYYPLLEEKQGLPCALYIRAGHDGAGTLKALNSILTGLRWKQIQQPLLLKGDWQPLFLNQAEELGTYVATALDAGIL